MKVKGLDLDTILCIKTERTLKNDRTIQHNTRFYQIEDKTRATRVVVNDLIDGDHARIPQRGVVALPRDSAETAKAAEGAPDDPQG